MDEFRVLQSGDKALKPIFCRALRAFSQKLPSKSKNPVRKI
jgi:hypothetical protein